MVNIQFIPDRSRRSFWGLLVAMGLFICGHSSYEFLSPDWGDPPAAHSIESATKYFNEFWMREDIYTRADREPRIGASNGMLIILGSSNHRDREGVIGVEADTGTIEWRKGTGLGFRAVLVVDSNAFFVGTTSGGEIIRHDLNDGSATWRTHLPGAGSVWQLSIANSGLQSYSQPGIFHDVDKVTGQANYSFEAEETVYRVSDDVMLMRGLDLSKLSSVDRSSGETNWASALGGAIYRTPVLVDQMAYVLSDSPIAELNAVDLDTGEILWKTDRVVVSNVAIDDEAAYVLTTSAELLAPNRMSGAQIGKVQFSAEQFILNGPLDRVGGHYLAADPSSNLVFALLGDSAQLFAFQVGVQGP